MFGLGVTEIAVILVVALLFLGPEKLPDVAKSLGRGLRDFRKATDDIKDTMNGTLSDAVREVRKPEAPAFAPEALADPTGHAPPEHLHQVPPPPPAVTGAVPALTAVPEERVASGKLPE